MPIENVIKQINNNQIILLENLTFHRGEIENDSGFLDNISSGIDFYVNDSFSSVEQTYASVVGFAAKLPMFARGAGLELAREFEILRKMKSNPIAPFSAIIDASDIAHIAPMMMSLYTNCNYILLTGPVALTVSLVLSGHSRQGFETEERMIREIISSANSWRVQLLLPKDFKGSIKGKKGTYNLNEITTHLDSFEMIEPGVETLVEYQRILERSKTVFHMSVGPCVGNVFRFSEENYSWLASLLSVLDANVVINDPNMTKIFGNTDLPRSNLFLCQGYKASNKYIEGKALPGLDVIMQ
jgi:phosphoglycerate kinase